MALCRNLEHVPRTPVVDGLGIPGSAVLALLLSVILLIKRKGNKVLLIAWAFPLLYWATLALAPVMCVRYVVPLFFTLPLIATIPLLTLKEL